MAGMNYKTTTVGAIAAYDYRAVPVFHRYGIDFCCHGEEPFTEACAKAGASVEEVVTALDNALQDQSEGSYSYAFKEGTPPRDPPRGACNASVAGQGGECTW